MKRRRKARSPATSPTLEISDRTWFMPMDARQGRDRVRHVPGLEAGPNPPALSGRPDVALPRAGT
jgi:hypothetical protein